jgi:hypothetical protein
VVPNYLPEQPYAPSATLSSHRPSSWPQSPRCRTQCLFFGDRSAKFRSRPTRNFSKDGSINARFSYLARTLQSSWFLGMDWMAWECARMLNLDCRFISVVVYYTATQRRNANAATHQKTRETRRADSRPTLLSVRRLRRLSQTHSIAILNLAVSLAINSRPSSWRVSQPGSGWRSTRLFLLPCLQHGFSNHGSKAKTRIVLSLFPLFCESF